jgi:hypothetical protein
MLVSTKVRQKGDIISIKLTNGEELISSFVEEKDQHLIIDRPVSLSTGPQGAPALMPFFMTASPDATRNIKLEKRHVVMTADTDAPLAKQYSTAMSGILPAGAIPGLQV